MKKKKTFLSFQTNIRYNTGTKTDLSEGRITQTVSRFVKNLMYEVERSSRPAVVPIIGSKFKVEYAFHLWSPGFDSRPVHYVD